MNIVMMLLPKVIDLMLVVLHHITVVHSFHRGKMKMGNINGMEDLIEAL